ncbi:MAG: uroporphyrinogen-III synthase [Bacteroides sp.]|nr:uroporphyrinogen-III synthase [Bacteroides sp.]MBD5281168.1 uroporphyrinogen-III synthase [Bacteroides sp.]
MKIKKILVSQPKPASDKSPYYDIAKRHDVEIVFRPFIKVEGLSAREFRQSKINLADYTAIIFTARTAVDHFFRLCEEMRVNVPDTMRYFCTTEAIALYLQKYIVYRKRKISFGQTGKLSDPQLLAAIQKNHKEKFLLPVSDVQADSLKPLEDAKIDFTPAMMYRTVSNDFQEGEPFDYDMLLFFSPAGIDSLLKNFPDFGKNGKQPVAIGTFGSATAQAVKDAGLRLDIEAPTPKTPSMTAALDAFLTENAGND